MPELSALVVAYTFPPHAAMGTMRTVRLLTCLEREGWRIRVLTGAPATYLPGTPTDATLVEKVPRHADVKTVSAWRPFVRLARLFGSSRATRRPDESGPLSAASRKAPAREQTATAKPLRRALRGLIRVPDKEVGWLVPAIVAGLRMPKADVIYSTAPPFTGHVAATVIATVRRIPLVVDFRDPWARAPWRDDRPAFAGRTARWLERMVITRAEAVLFASETNRTEYANWYGPRAAERFHVVRNGCDLTDFNKPRPAATSESGKRPFVLLHAGSLYGGRNPVPLLESLDRLLSAGRIDRDRFRLRLLGSLSVPGLDLRAVLRKLRLESSVEVRERVPRHEALEEMVSASALLLLQPGTTVSIPGKLYEYFAAERPILAIVEEGELADLVRSTGTGVVAHPNDASTIDAGLRRLVIEGFPEFRSAPETLYDGMARAAEAVDVLRRGALSRRARRAAYNEA